MEYKGFEIEQSSLNDRFYVGERIAGAGFLDADFCPQQGYATESAAKVAISKFLKQQEQVQSHQEFISRAEEGLRNENVVEALPVLKKIMQQRNIISVQQSRNKREGKYDRKLNGHHRRIGSNHCGRVPKNRKQRKAAKLAWWKQVDNVCDKLFG